MGRNADDREQRVSAACFFVTRAREAIALADAARSEDAGAAHVREAETWLNMAARSLAPPGAPKPRALPPPPPRIGRERRSFLEE